MPLQTLTSRSVRSISPHIAGPNTENAWDHFRLSTSTPMLTSCMLPKLKQNHRYMMYVCTALQCSSGACGVAAAILSFAGDLVKSERGWGVRLIYEQGTWLTLPNPSTLLPRREEKTQTCWGWEKCECARERWQGNSEEPKPTHRFLVNLIEWFNIKHHQKAGRKRNSRKGSWKVSTQSTLIRKERLPFSTICPNGPSCQYVF